MLVELLSADYKEIQHNPGADVPMGTMTTMQDTHGFPIADVDISVQAKGAFIVKAEKARAPKDGVAILEGEAVYWTSGGTDAITNIAGTDLLVGICQRDAAIGDANVIFEFDGFADFLKT